jgi:hypothetical protein
MCPNSSNGEHNFQLQPIITEGETIIVKICILCNAEG